MEQATQALLLNRFQNPAWHGWLMAVFARATCAFVVQIEVGVQYIVVPEQAVVGLATFVLGPTSLQMDWPATE